MAVGYTLLYVANNMVCDEVLKKNDSSAFSQTLKTFGRKKGLISSLKQR